MIDGGRTKAPRNSAEWPDSTLSGAGRSSRVRTGQNRHPPLGGNSLNRYKNDAYTEFRLPMPQALTFIVLTTLVYQPCAAAEHKTWNQIQYVGGTVPIKASRYDFNTTLSLTADAIVVEIAPATVFQSKKTVRIPTSQVLSLSSNDAAWQRVAAVDGAKLPAKPPTLFGVLLNNNFLGLVYQQDDGRKGAMLLDSISSPIILRVLSKLTGKPIESAP